MHETNEQLLLAVVHAWRIFLLAYGFIVIGATIGHILVDWSLDDLDWFEILGRFCYTATIGVPVFGIVLLSVILGINSIPQSWYGR